MNKINHLSKCFLQTVLIINSTMVGLSGCATSSIFVSYPLTIQPIKEYIRNDQFKIAQDILDKQRNNADNILYMMERARVSQIGNDTLTSIEDFKQVIGAFRLNDDKAIISASDTVSQSASLLSNDNAIPYAGDAYERVFVYHFQALNYLFNNEIEKALVEVRRANDEQQFALELHEKEIAAVQEQIQSKTKNNEKFLRSFSALENAAGRVKNSFQNAYTFYASGIIYEATGKYNDAYIDFRKALNIFPKNKYLQRDVLRLSKQLGIREDYQRYKKKFSIKENTSPKNHGIDKNTDKNMDKGEIVVLYEHGYAPIKMEIKVPLIVGNRVHTVAFPIYVNVWQSTSPLTLSMENGKKLGQTMPIVYVQSLAAKALQEKLPSMMLRQILRLITKKQTSDASQELFGDVGRFATDIFNLISENADRRSWLTLPNDAQIFRGTAPSGEYKLMLNNANTSNSMYVEVKPGKKTIIRIIDTGTTLRTDYIVL